jgi:hypothetical protein
MFRGCGGRAFVTLVRQVCNASLSSAVGFYRGWLAPVPAKTFSFVNMKPVGDGVIFIVRDALRNITNNRLMSDISDKKSKLEHPMKVPVIHTIDARENVFLEAMSSRFKWTTSQMYQEINRSATQTIAKLKEKDIDYVDLKNALIPRKNRREIAFVFDTRLISSSWYGFEVAKVLIPLLDKRSVNSILYGDYFGDNTYSEMYKGVFYKYIRHYKGFTYKGGDLFYLVYINNLSTEQFNTLHIGLQKIDSYVGFFDLTFSSPIKTLLSSILVRAILKFKTTIINPTESSVDENISGFPFERNGYRVIGIDDILYSVFLSYKIEREVFPGYEADLQFSVNALSKDVVDISELQLIIEIDKMQYLQQQKSGSMETAGFSTVTTEELANIIEKKLKDNYIYSLSFLPNYGTMKFNLMIEVPRNDHGELMKLIVAMEYAPREKSLRLITMF